MSTWPNRGCLRRPLRGAGIMKAEQQEEKSDHPGLTQANRPPRNPVRFSCVDWKRWGTEGFLGLQTQPGAYALRGVLALNLMGE